MNSIRQKGMRSCNLQQIYMVQPPNLPQINQINRSSILRPNQRRQLLKSNKYNFGFQSKQNTRFHLHKTKFNEPSYEITQKMKSLNTRQSNQQFQNESKTIRFNKQNILDHQNLTQNTLRKAYQPTKTSNLTDILKLAQSQELEKTKQSLLKQKVIQLQLKEEVQNLRNELYELRNTLIDFQNLRIHLRKVQEQLNESNFLLKQKVSENERLALRIFQLQRQNQRMCHQVEVLGVKYLSEVKINEQLRDQNQINVKAWQKQREHFETQMSLVERSVQQAQIKFNQMNIQMSEINYTLEQSERKLIQSSNNQSKLKQKTIQLQNSLKDITKNFQQKQHKWTVQLKRNQLLFQQLQKVIEDKCREILELQRKNDMTNIQSKQISEKLINEKQVMKLEVIRLKQQNTTLKSQIQRKSARVQKQTSQQNIQKDQSPYIPKKWFQQKIEYQYTINALSNQIQLLRATINPTSNSQISNPSIETQTQKIQIDPQVQQLINLQQKKLLIQQLRFKQYQEKISQLQKLLIDQKNTKQTLEENYKNLLASSEQKLQKLKQQYLQEKMKLVKEKSLNQDLTIQVLLLDQQLKESEQKVKSKQYL